MEILANGLDVGWTLIAGFLVFFMQAGFALCEAGLTRAKNTGNILMKNLMDFCIGTPCFWLIGFGIMFYGKGALIGGFDPLIRGDYSFLGLDMPIWAYVFFQTVFCATAATIVSGSMAERTNFKAYCIYSAVISLFVYPVSGHWIWGGGWLSGLGFHDFAGSTCVHMVGGIIACLGAWMLGPRIGKYDKEGKPHAILGHNMTAMALGVFILWFCWFGFNGGSTIALSSTDAQNMASLVCFNTNLSAAVSTLTAMIFTWVRYGKPDVSMTFNATLAGLVAITAPCDVVTPIGAFFIGLVAGILVVLSVEFFDNKAKIDDPVGAVSVHMMNGIWGTLSVGLFSTGANGVGKGLFYGGGFKQLGLQFLGMFSTMAWTVVTITLAFLLIKKIFGLRVNREEEIEGLDASEHGLQSAYAGIAMLPEYIDEDATVVSGDVPVAEAVEVKEMPKAAAKTPVSPDGKKMTKVEIVCKEAKLEKLKNAMMGIGITGMTVTHVLGCGAQKGRPEYYRGVEVEAALLPKIQVDIVVSAVPVASVIDTAKKVLYTGHIGDGKIFVYDVENVVKVRTGEEGYDALQDVE